MRSAAWPSRRRGRSSPSAGGKGLATELARASVRVAFGSLRLREIIAITLPDNLASQRVMEKAGFAYGRDIVHVGLVHCCTAAARTRNERDRGEKPDA